MTTLFPRTTLPSDMRLLSPSPSPSTTGSRYTPIPAPPTMRMSFGTNVSTVCSCSGCLYRRTNQRTGSDNYAGSTENTPDVPALLDVNHIFLAHLWSSIIVLIRSLRKAKETVKLRANIASFTYSPGEWKDALCQFMYDFQFSVFLILQAGGSLSYQ